MLCLLAASLAPTARGEDGQPSARRDKRVLRPGKAPLDDRLGPLKGETGDFLFAPATSAEQAALRAEQVRRIMRVSLGIWPWPTKTPLRAAVFGKIVRPDYTIEKVYFESVPGFYVTGNLYRPRGAPGKRPAVLSPHGHFPGGRFIDEGRDAVRQKIVVGAERFEEGGRSFMQSRCVQLARMGCVVFHYDMIGYGDSQQLSLDLVHRFSRSRIKFKEPPATGLYSAGALLNLQNPMGLHTYNSIRALDFLCSLPDVDTERIAVTGGSGGGTQSFMLCAVDDRPLVSVPVVIVSTTRQGGCTCENICGLRYGTYNIEFAALHAPKPMLLISADDATRTLRERGFPELQRHYRAWGAGGNVAHASLTHFPHNYNYVSRAVMYRWLNKHLRLGRDEPIIERDYTRLSHDELTVWDDSHPRPEGGSDFERKLLKWFSDDARRQIEALRPRDRASWTGYEEVVGGGWDVLLRRLPREADVRFELVRETETAHYREQFGLLEYRTFQGFHAELPAVKLVPRTQNGRAVVWIDGEGKAGLFDDDGQPQPHIQSLLDSGHTIIGLDLLQQGEFLVDGKPVTRQRSLPNEEAFAGWTYCYNLPLYAHRVHDVLAAIALAGQTERVKQVFLVGVGGAGKWAAGASAQARGKLAGIAIDAGGFRFGDVKDVYHVDFLPGAVKYGDMPTLLSLSAPTPMWLTGAGDGAIPAVESAYRSLGAPSRLTMMPPPESSGSEAMAVAKWIAQAPPAVPHE